MLTNSDLQVFVTKLKGLYGDRFPGLLPEMAREWLSDLHHLDEEVLEKALHRWARQHTFKAPSLDELLEQVEMVREDEQRTRRHGTRVKTYLAVLKEAVEAEANNPVRTDEDVTYSRLMCLLAERSMLPWADSKKQLRPKLTMEQRAEQCLLWANKYESTRPQLAEDLRYAARTAFGGGGLMYMAQGVAVNDEAHEEKERPL